MGNITVKKKFFLIRIYEVIKNKGLSGLIEKIKIRLKNESDPLIITPFYSREINPEIIDDLSILPVSVIIPTAKSRYRFTNEFVLPLIEANNPAEILIIDDEDKNVQEKRNKGVELSTQEYIFFCDDDIILPKNHLRILYHFLKDRQDLGYVYTDYLGIVIDRKNHPSKENFYQKARDFDPEYLKHSNYISTMSLIRKECISRFDTEIKRFQDWDLWISMLKKGVKGCYVSETGFLAFYLDAGITSNGTSVKEARNAIIKKHNL